MPCSITCMLSVAIIISMIYFQNATSQNKFIKEYKTQLPSHLQKLYNKITNERLKIYYYGYTLGFILSLFIIFYNYYMKRNKLTTFSLICSVVVVSFFSNYFYYMLSDKSSYMLEHVNSPEQTKAWLTMYRIMQYNYHLGMVIGIIGIGMLAFAFRC